MNVSELQKETYQVAKSRGWYQEAASRDEIWKHLGNIHTEISEAWELARQPDFNPQAIWVHEKKGSPEGLPIELADVILRVLATAEHYGIDMESALVEKIHFNKTRPWKHGGKVI